MIHSPTKAADRISGGGSMPSVLPLPTQWLSLRA